MNEAWMWFTAQPGHIQAIFYVLAAIAYVMAAATTSSVWNRRWLGPDYTCECPEPSLIFMFLFAPIYWVYRPIRNIILFGPWVISLVTSFQGPWSKDPEEEIAHNLPCYGCSCMIPSTKGQRVAICEPCAKKARFCPPSSSETIQRVINSTALTSELIKALPDEAWDKINEEAKARSKAEKSAAIKRVEAHLERLKKPIVPYVPQCPPEGQGALICPHCHSDETLSALVKRHGDTGYWVCAQCDHIWLVVYDRKEPKQLPVGDPDDKSVKPKPAYGSMPDPEARPVTLGQMRELMSGFFSEPLDPRLDPVMGDCLETPAGYHLAVAHVTKEKVWYDRTKPGKKYSLGESRNVCELQDWRSSCTGYRIIKRGKV